MAAKKRAKAYELPLEFLNPAEFPDLEAVRAFFDGPAYTAMRYALEDSLNPTLEVPIHEALLGVARNAADRLSQDIEALTRALAHGRPVRAVPGREWSEHGRIHVLALTLAQGSTVADDHLRELLRLLVDPTPAHSPVREKAAAAPQRARASA